MTDDRLYWSSLEERARALRAEPAAPAGGAGLAGSDAGGGASGLSRRGFLAATGFTLAGAVAGCGRAPVQTTATPPSQPPEAVPGQALHYATTCGGCSAGCGLLVRCRDGRPVKVEGNPDHPLSGGGVCAAGQAALLGLYDSRRLLAPRLRGAATTYEALDAEVRAGIERARAAGRGVRLLTRTVNGPSTQAWIDAFLAAVPGARAVAADALSSSAVAAAHARTHGAARVPRLRLEACDVLLAVESDLLGTGPSPVEHLRGWRAARSLEGQPPRSLHHVQVESMLTLTGSNADRRHRLRPSHLPAFVAHLSARVAARAGRPAPAAPGEPPLGAPALDALVERLWAARGRAVVVCGLNDVEVQAHVNLANEALGAYGATLDLAAPSLQRLGDDAALSALLDECAAGTVGVLIVAGGNPLAEAPGGAALAARLAPVELLVALAERDDETTACAHAVVPLPHALESWDDAEPVDGLLSLTQPALEPLGAGRTLRASLAAWIGRPAADLELVRAAFRERVLPRLGAGGSFETLWSRAVHDGFARLAPRSGAAGEFRGGALAPLPAPPPAGSALELVLHAQVGMLDGRHAHNAWLHELPDPITKVVWGNVAALSPATAQRLGVDDGDVLRLEAGGAVIELPALRLPGLCDDTVAVALGYGRAGTDRFADVGPSWLEGEPTVPSGSAVGAATAALLRFQGGAVSYAGREVAVRRTGARRPPARSQTWSTQDLPAHLAPKRGARREMVRELDLAGLAADPGERAGGHGAAPAGTHAGGHGAALWDRPAGARRWGLVIDLSACTGCSACVVACQVENNVPVVGRDEVLRRRDLAWMRIDRYFADVPGAPGDVDVVHQPMLCHHCGNAPCESVCPVLATAHSSEGLNEQVYNRCVGTRYCANNCPFKVRRFNWFEYDRPDPWADLALNPDVTVRTRGVMEKCSMCVQRIAEGRAQAAVRGTPLRDGEVRTACQQTCPTGAIVFGDLQDAGSAVARAAAQARRYELLPDLNLKPTVSYLAKVRHRGDRDGGRHG